MMLQRLMMKAAMAVTVAAALVAAPAQARFGKGGTGGGSHSGSSGGSHGGSSAHGAVPVGSAPSHGSGSGGGYVSSGSGAHYGYGYGYNGYARPWYGGYYGGDYIPAYGYGYGYGYGYAPGYRTMSYGYAPGGTAGHEPSSVRVTVGAEAMALVNTESGFALGVHAAVEGERWGFNLVAQNTTLRTDDGTSGYDNIPQVNAHLTFAFLTGKWGRLRAEAGVDSVFAPNVTFLGPTGGLSGSLWLGGPLALEGSAMFTPWPFGQMDYRAGLALGLGPVGLRAGWRTQVLDDRGVVDGVTHRDVYMGPYAGLAFTF